MRKIDHCKAWSGVSDHMIIELVGALVIDPLAKTLRDHKAELAKEDPPREPSWDDLKRIIRENFLSERESEILRDQVTTITQEPYEDSRTYSLRFKTAVQRAYTAEEQKIDIVKLDLIRRFINGFRDQDVKLHCHLKNPTSLDDAIASANAAARAVSLSEPDPRDIEPMELGSLSAPIHALPLTTTPSQPPKPPTSPLDELKSCMKGIQKEIASLRKEIKPPNPNTKKTRFENGKVSCTNDRPPLRSNYVNRVCLATQIEG